MLGVHQTELFESLRGRLFGLAYRMLGSRADAEDVLQEAYLRWHQVDRATVQNPEAWLVTATSRLAIDRLRRLKTEREAYVGPWLPEPIVSRAPAPDRDVSLAEDLSIAFLTLLERLAPDERAAFLLHDVFDLGYPDIAAVLDRSEAACRQVVHRARERVRGDRKRFEATETAKASLLRTFTAALEARDEQTLLTLFAPDATWTADGGGKVAASPYPIVGADRIAKLVIGLREKFWANERVLEAATVNGESGLCIRDGDRIVATLAIETDGQRILAVYAVVNPEKLRPVTDRAFPPSSVHGRQGGTDDPTH
jgi:RNA polymerase sigma-70 factor, ECF subfamily